VEHDGFSLTFESRLSLDDIQQAVKEVRSRDVASIRPVIDEDAIEGLKFSECLPNHLAVEMLEQRLSDTESTRKTLEQTERYVAGWTQSD
jgi:ATP-dependent Lhr-like helicase